MADIRPFSCVRPTRELAHKVAALPYDVYSREEALEEVQKEPLSFLKVDRAETSFDYTVNMYDDRVYEKAKEILYRMVEDGILIEDTKECYYVYELIMNGRHQNGIVACASIDDYINNTIMTHEDTREDKELDRIKHVDICNAQTGPIFLAYRHNETIHNLVDQVKKKEPLYSFEAKDYVRHNVWQITEVDTNKAIKEAFESMNHIYIADGHHRAASAVKVGLKRRENELNTKENVGKVIKDSGKGYEYFLSVLFPDDELMIYPYFRVVRDLNGYEEETFLKEIEKYFHVECKDGESYLPNQKMNFGMYLENKWYKLSIKEEVLIKVKDECNINPVKSLDVSLLQDYLLEPFLNIKDPRTDKRIDFVGGIRGITELEKRVNEDMKVAFTLYPTSIKELFAVSDSNRRMPPKSTWFEPKLRSGLFIHRIDRDFE